MPEAITKYAVNSTLGTDDFMPLDQIIVNQVKIAPSDNVKLIIREYSSTNREDYRTYKSPTYKMNMDGVIRIIATGLWGFDQLLSLHVYKNNEKNGALLGGWGSSTSTNREPIIDYIDISVNKNDEIYIISNPSNDSYDTLNGDFGINLCGDTYLAHPRGIMEVIG